MTDLSPIIARAQALTKPSREVDALIMWHLFAVPVGDDKGYLWPDDNPSWNFGLVFDERVNPNLRRGKETLQFMRPDGRWVLMNSLRVPSLTASVDAALALAERVLPKPLFIDVLIAIPLSGPAERDARIYHDQATHGAIRNVTSSLAIAIVIATLKAKMEGGDG